MYQLLSNFINYFLIIREIKNDNNIIQYLTNFKNYKRKKLFKNKNINKKRL